MTSPALNNRDQSDFGAMLFETFRACEGRSCVVLDRVLTVKVRAWADEQSTREASDFASYTHEPAIPFEEGTPA